ncbi:hypothetical protein FO440_06090 [Mucilaginibacter corticis]|uniref:Uncharacterized protein n=1 Tax=Mucilaginibacter corticis TaxID=2597670 RepID=A0A556MUZ3_9SPHI|nr:hypothetical protein [Mucilaginibacter corticis]TSJ43756.1 hypothetical protein FO440_06090 [Mucilaginibacter corticis]
MSGSILIPIIIGAVRIKRLNKVYYPFFIFLLLGLLSELVSFILIEKFKTGNAADVKVYSLIECCIILYQLYVWKSSAKYRRRFIFIAVACVVFWMIEHIVFLNINTWTPYFRVFYAFVIVLLSVNQINSMMFNHDEPLFKNPRFIICLGFIIFFLYQILYEAAYYIGSGESTIADKIIFGNSYNNFFTNVMYAVAIFIITAKKEDVYNQYLSEQ